MDGKGTQKDDLEIKGKAQIIAMQIREFRWEFKFDPVFFFAKQGRLPWYVNHYNNSTEI